MSEPDKLAQKWGAYGGDRKLSPRFRTLHEMEVEREKARTLRYGIFCAVLSAVVLMSIIISI